MIMGGSLTAEGAEFLAEVAGKLSAFLCENLCVLCG